MGLLETGERGYYDTESYGNYQFVSLEDIINQFMIIYTGSGKVINKTSRTDVAFFAQRGLAEMSFDTFKCVKSQEVDIPASLSIILPQDYVNYTKLSWVDSSGVKHPLYPTKHTNNPFRKATDSDGDFIFNADGTAFYGGELIKNGNFNGTLDYWTIQGVTNTFDGELLNEPDTGWFVQEFIGSNKLNALNIPEDGKLIQNDVSIINGEDYEVTFTISNYVSGSWKWVLVDEKGRFIATTARTANGTYTEKVTPGNIPGVDLGKSRVYILNDSALAVGTADFDDVSIKKVGAENESTTSNSYKSQTPAENKNDDYEDDVYWPGEGERYGLEPSHAQVNGSFYIDELRGKINFSSNISGKTVILDYISDSLGTDGEMQVHKFAEEAMYKYIIYAIMSGKANVSAAAINRAKREKFAATRQAKLRLSNFKLEELTQILRGKSKWIKH